MSQFPFDPELAATVQLESVPITHLNHTTHLVEEFYTCDATGGVKVTIRNLGPDYDREYRLSRWTGKTDAIRPSASKRARRASS